MPQMQQRKNNKKNKQNNIGKIVAGIGGAAVVVGVGGGIVHHVDSTLNTPTKKGSANSDSYQSVHFRTPNKKNKNKITSKKEQSEEKFNEDVNTLLGKTPQQIKAENLDFEKNVADLLNGVSNSSSNSILNDLLVNIDKNTNNPLSVDNNINKLITKSINADQALLNVVNTVDNKQNTNTQQNAINNDSNNQDSISTALDKLLNHHFDPFTEIDNNNNLDNVTYHPTNNVNNTITVKQNDSATPIIPNLNNDDQFTNKSTNDVDSAAVIHSSVIASQGQPAQSNIVPVIPDTPHLPDSAISPKPITSNSNIQPSQAPIINSQHQQTSQINPTKPVNSAANIDAEINSIVDSLASAGDLGSCSISKITSAVTSAVNATKNENLLTPNNIASMATSAAHQMTSQVHPINSATSQTSHAASITSATSSHSAISSQTSANTSHASQATSQNTNTSYASQASQATSAISHAAQTNNSQATTSAAHSAVSANNSQTSHVAKQPTSATSITSGTNTPAQSAINKPNSMAKSVATSQAIKSKTNNTLKATTSIKN